MTDPVWSIFVMVGLCLAGTTYYIVDIMTLANREMKDIEKDNLPKYIQLTLTYEFKRETQTSNL